MFRAKPGVDPWQEKFTLMLLQREEEQRGKLERATATPTSWTARNWQRLKESKEL
jgi:hypothetical protein